VIPALLLALACTPEPTTVAECAQLGTPAEVEDCRFRLVQPLVGDDKALDAALAEIDDPGSRDLLLLRLAISDPPRAGRLCRKVETEGAKARCQQVLGRPHLSTTRQAPKPPAAPGGAPADTPKAPAP
jgi:hypothetical protein